MPGALAEKLRVESGQKLLLWKAPDGYRELLGDLPDDASVSTQRRGSFDFVHLFVGSRADVERDAQKAVDAVKAGGLLWISYPKGGSGVETDISRDSLWQAMKPTGWRPVTQVSLDDTWSAIRFRPEADVKARG